MTSLLVPLSERDHLLDGEQPSSALQSGSPVLSSSRRASLSQAARVSKYTFISGTASAYSPQISRGRSDLQLAGIGSTPMPNLELRTEYSSLGIFDEKLSEAEYEKMSLFEGLNYHTIDNDLYQIEMRDSTAKTRVLDSLVRWLIAALIGLVMGLVAFGVDTAISRLQEIKHHQVGLLFYQSGLWTAWLVACGINGTMVLLGALCILFLSPTANSSGIPQIKAYLNGSKIRKVFNLNTFLVKAVSCISAISTTMPVGPEGPMIHMGGMIGGGVSQSHSKTLNVEWTFLSRFRNDRDRRDFIAIGAACGTVLIFGCIHLFGSTLLPI
jgi:hypothetical protein